MFNESNQRWKQMKRIYMTAAMAVLLGGCSGTNDYTPPEGASGETIFKQACAQCHSADVGKIFTLDADMGTPAAIKAKVANGGMGMPSFPNIKGASADALADYVLANADVAK